MAYLRPTVKMSKNASGDPEPEKSNSEMYEIGKSVIVKLRSRYRDIANEDISRLIDALLDDISMYVKKTSELMRENAKLAEKYEDLKAIKINSASPVLFPQQRQTATQQKLNAMQLQRLKYLEDLLKKDELEIAGLKGEISRLKGEK